MQLFWQIVKKSTTDLWDEMLLMLVFNIIWIVGMLLVIPLPFVTFGLFYICYNVAQGKGIKFTQFFRYGRDTWKPAYIWGMINIFALGVFAFNIMFYAQFSTSWAAMLRVMFTSLIVVWLLWQLVAVALYPRLVEPGFRLAAQNAAVLIGKNPVVVVLLGLLIAFLVAVSSVVPAFGIALGVSLTALLVTNTVHLLLKKEMASPDD